MDKQIETDNQIYKKVSRRAWIVNEFKPLLKGSDSEQLKELADLIINEAINRDIIDEVFTNEWKNNNHRINTQARASFIGAVWDRKTRNRTATTKGVRQWVNKAKSYTNK